MSLVAAAGSSLLLELLLAVMFALFKLGMTVLRLPKKSFHFSSASACALLASLLLLLLLSLLALSVLLLILGGVLGLAAGTDATDTGALAAGSAATALPALPPLLPNALRSLPKSGSLTLEAAGALLLVGASLLLSLSSVPSTAAFTAALALLAFAARDPSSCPRSGSLICTGSLLFCPCVRILGSWILGI
jgi:hypothetical protein